MDQLIGNGRETAYSQCIPSPSGINRNLVPQSMILLLRFSTPLEARSILVSRAPLGTIWFMISIVVPARAVVRQPSSFALVVTLVTWLFPAAVFAEAPSSPFSKGPYIQFPALDKVTIMWESTTNIPGSVRLGPGLTPDQQLQSVMPVEKRSQTSAAGTNSSATAQKRISFYLYKATFSDLWPGSVYSYSVELQGFQSPPCHFRTLDPRIPQTRFVVYGDSRSDPKMHAAVTAQFAKYEPDFILHTGDLVAKGTDYSLWSREFFKPAASFLDHVPFFSVIGNHEQDGTNYLNYFDLPGNELWYSFDVGPVHVLALDFRFEKAKHDQFRFARKDLRASRAPWKLVVLHTPLYNIGGHASDWGHADYLPLFHETKVDMVLTGHSHMYERFRPLAPKRSAGNWAITHVTTGGGAASLHKALPHPALVTQETTNHFLVIEATPTRLETRAFRVDGSLLDSFTLTKVRGRMTRDYLALTYPEESLDLFYELAPALTPVAAAIPTASSPARIEFQVPHRPRASSRAKLEITLTPEAARNYELVSGALQVATPGPGKTNIVWAEVRATGSVQVTTNSSRELSPALTFQSTVTAAEGETLTYGSKAKLKAATKKTAQGS
jgi:acid phosphatase type 7